MLAYATIPLTEAVRPTRFDPPMNHCSVTGCERVTYGRQQLCEAHYRRRRRTGHLSVHRPVGAPLPTRECMVDNCEGRATERGLCHGHYLRLIRLGHVQDERPLGRRVNATCTVDGCDQAATARGLCDAHRYRKHGDVREHVPVRKVAGTGFIHHGYFWVPVPRELRHLTGGETPAAEHRLVMAQMLGRPLSPEESVHHRSGNRLDNRPENLELWSRWQPRGQRVCDKIEYALEILEWYLPSALLPQAELPFWGNLGKPNCPGLGSPEEI